MRALHDFVEASLATGAAQVNTDAPKQRESMTHAGATFCDSSTKPDIGDGHSFWLKEGTHRRPEMTQKRYHVAFHPPVSSALPLRANEIAERAPTLISRRYEVDAQSPTALSPALVRSFDDDTRRLDVWKSVDDSINQLYQDPPIDLVKGTLFHANLGTDGQSRSRFKQKQRRRILAAVEELREVKTQQQVERDQVWRRKEQIQALSETIRRRNKKFARSVDGTEAIDDATNHLGGDSRGSHHGQSAVSVTARKPPVPRLSGLRSKTSKRKRTQNRPGSGRSEVESTDGDPTASTSGTGGNGAAASILLGDLGTRNSHEQQHAEAQEGAPDITVIHRTSDAATEEQSPLHQSNKRRSAPRRSGAFRKKAHEQSVKQDDGRVPRPSEALDQRRAIAREYMVLQQQQRMIRKSEAQQRELMEREKRRQQLEILEKRRLENLKHSRKRRLPQKQVPARRRNKARAKTPTVSESLPILPGSDQDSAEEGKEMMSHIMPSDDQDQLSDAENDGAQGNVVVGHQQQGPSDLLKSPNSFTVASRSLLFGGAGPASIVKEKEQSDAANAHIQKLLDLRQKAQELSKRLSGIRSAQHVPESRASATKAHPVENDESCGNAADSETDRVERPLQRQEREGDMSNQYGDAQTLSTKLEVESLDREEDGMSDEVEDSEENNSDEEELGDRVGHNDGGTASDARQETKEGESSNDEGSISELQHRDTIIDAARYDMPSSIVDMPDGMDVDVRSIGVYNIAVVWPLAHENPSAEDSTRRFTEISSSASSPSSSQSDRNANERDEALERMRGDGVDDNASNSESGSDVEVVARFPKRSERTRRASEEWSAARMAELVYSIDSMSKFSPGSSEHPCDDRVGFATTTWRLDMGSAPSDAFFQLVQAEDDSLSVIQRTALKLYERQQERERLRRENEKQQHHEQSMLDSPNEPQGSDDANDSPARQFARLDEIMQEVDRERSLERVANEMGKSDDDELDQSCEVDSDEASSDHGERITGARGQVTASSEFWNQLIFQSAVEDSKDGDSEEDAGRSRVLSGRPTHHIEIDTSELEAQREQRLRLAERAVDDDDDDADILDDLGRRTGRSRRRIHSPRSLTKRLLAEVEYHEAINDAHLKLTVMEQAQLLEQAQAETINIATAFKEEMEQSAVNHQLALDHAMLAKRFDDDLHGVVQQLHSIDELEEQEYTARQIATEIQLKQARMRECSVQTENLRVADVGTSAPLHVDAGTSPIVPSESTAVQYEFSGSGPPAGSPGSKLQVSMAEEEGDAYEDSFAEPLKVEDIEAVDYDDDGFEQESGLHSRSYGVQGGSDVEDKEIRSEGGSAKSAAIYESSEAESVIESATSLTGSNIVASEDASEEIEEEDDGDSAAVASATRSEADDNVESATVEYEDDFNASSPTAKAGRSLASNEIDDDFNAEREYGEGAGDGNDRSADDVDVEEEDELEDDVEALHNTITDSSKDASIEGDFEDEFAQSVDNEVEDEEDLQDDAGDDAQVDEALPVYSAKTAHPVTKEEMIPQSAELRSRSPMSPPSATIEAPMHYPGMYTGGFGYPQQSMAPPTSLYSLAVIDATQSEHVIQAYMAELERRKQSEMSMFGLRLQAAEAHFVQQAQRIDAAIADGKWDASAKAELTARKQRLTIAFMGEKANVESLKAAATARYFQDMLAFQSLYASDSPNVAVADGASLNFRDLPHIRATTAEIPVLNVSSRVESVTTKSSVAADSKCYEDEFASVTQGEAGNDRSSIAESVEKSIMEEEDAYKSEKQTSDVSVASDIDIEPDFEEETQEKRVEEDDDDHPKEEDEVQSDEYAQSEFEDETQDTPEEQTIVEETTPQDEIDEFENEVENAESAEVASEVDDAEGEFETSEIQEEDDGHVDSEDQSESHCAKSDDIEDGGYDDDFASVSASMHHQESGHTSDEDAVVEEETDHAPGESDVIDEVESTPSVVMSEHDHEAASADSEDEINEAPGGLVRGSDASASAAAYSEDEFEASEHAEASQTVAKPTLNIAESVAHSTSDDSSTTKLLVAEVDAVQKTVAAGGDTTHDADAQSYKLMWKKAKVIELLEAKERLLEQQTRSFRLEEKKRMVNEAAHLALGLDVSQELRKAKDSIVSELESEFDALKMSFPKLKKLTEPLSVEKRGAPDVTDEPAPQSAPAVEQPAAIQAITEPRRNVDSGDYDAQSFEAVSESEASKSAGEEDDDLPDDAPIADFASDRVQVSIASENYSEFGEDESAAKEDTPEGVNDAGADPVQSEVEEEEEQFETGGGGDEVAPSDGGVASEGEGYENDYENESFADAQSAASVVDEDDDDEDTLQSEMVVEEAETSDTVARSASAVQSDAASEYTEDDFEQASESEATPSVHSNGDEEEESEAVSTTSVAGANHQSEEVPDAGDAQSPVSDYELSAALAIVASKLEVDSQDVEQHDEGLEKPFESVLDRADESTRELAASVLTPAMESRPEEHSTSASSEEETLTKSIEERMARLEGLKALILERQNDIRQVHKQLRIEKHKEALTTEEKALWAEMEGLEHELKCDVASLELIRQRNRLEFDQLEARQQRASINPLGFERDLLAGFDHIEAVEPSTTKANLQRDVDVQTPSGVEVECQTVAAPPFKEKVLTSAYLSDLLAGYDFVEHAQEVVTPAEVTANRNNEDIVAESISDFSIGKLESLACDHIVMEHPSATRETEDATEDYDALEEQEHFVDLLLDFAYVEPVEPLCAVKADLLAGFDYTEDVEPLMKAPKLQLSAGHFVDRHSAEEIAAGESERLAGDANSLDASTSDDHDQFEGEQSSAATTAVGTTEPNMLSDFTTAAEMQPGNDEEVGEDGPFGDDVDGDEASPPILSTRLDVEVGGNDHDQERALDEGTDSAAAAIVESLDDEGEATHDVSGEQATEAADATMVDTISSLILADLLQDMDSDAMLELKAWRQARARVRPAPTKTTDPASTEITRTESVDPGDADFNDDEANRDYPRNELEAVTLQVIGTAVVAKEAPGLTVQDEHVSDLAAQADATTESIFSGLFDDVLLSQLRAEAARRASYQQLQSRPLLTPKGPEAAASSTPAPIPSGTSEYQPAQGLANNSGVMMEVMSRQLFIDQTLSTLQVHDNCIRLDGFNSLKSAGLAPDSARLLHDAIEEIGQSALDAHHAADSNACPAIGSKTETNEELLLALRQAIRRELETVHSIQTELHESADRRLKALADADDQMDDEDVALLRLFSARPTSVSNLIATAAPTWIARPPSMLSTSTASGSVFTPRTPTPTSRGKSRARRSLLTLARSRQAAELQRRVTSAIFDDLLEDATAMLHGNAVNH